MPNSQLFSFHRRAHRTGLGPRSHSDLVPRKGYGEFAKELSGTLPYATAPQEENLPEMGGNLEPDPVSRPCYQSLPAPRMNVAFVPSAASQGFQATTSSQEGTSGAARAGDRDDQTSRGPHPEREAVRWALAKRGRPVARPRGPSLTAALQPGARATARPRAGSPSPVPPPVWGSSHRLCRSSWLSLRARRLRQLMKLRLVCRRSRWSKVPVFGRGPGAGSQDPPLKGARGAGRDAQRPWIGARMLAHTPEELLRSGSSS